MQIRFSKKFSKLFDKSSVKIRKAVNERIKLFKKDPFDPVLRNHLLRGKLLGYRSINITGDWRAIFLEENDSVLVSFMLLDTHSNLYG